MKLKRAVVTGLGALTPIGNTLDEYWKNLLIGKSGAGLITHFDASKFKTRFACEIKDFNPEDFISAKEARKMDKFTQFAIVSSKEAIVDAELDLTKVDLDRVGVIWGCGIGGIYTFEKEMINYIKGGRIPRFSPYFIPKIIVDIAPGFISMKHGFRGPNFSTVSACASSANAIIDALNYVRLGIVDLMVTGGSEASVTEAAIGGFNALRALSQRNDDPATASRPFEKNRDGFVMGEGSGSIIVEEYEHAISRGAKIYCEIIGAGLSADAYHLTAPHPEGIGATKVMSNCLENANLSIEDVDAINVHGTSTPLGDMTELKAIQKLFGKHAYNLNINSTKSMTGHLLGASGVIESIATILSIKHGIIPPTINQIDLDENIDPGLNLTSNKSQKRDLEIAMSNTFGFGGHNACILFKKIEH